jgi:trimethylamine---corrinoid protein Co-methyltransferase
MMALIPSLPYSRLSEEQIQAIHAASLEILEDIGVRLQLSEAVELARKGDGWVDEAGRTHIPAQRVEWALRAAPRRVTLYNRHGEAAMPLEGRACFFGPGSDCLNILDHRSGERRKPLLADVAEGVRLCDALANIDFVMSMFLPADVDPVQADIYQAEVIFANTVKPVVFVSYETRGLMAAVEMAEAVMGGEQALREKPLLTCYINVVSGAMHNADGLRKLLFLADKGLPVLYIPGSNAGVTSPSTMAGAVALDLAGGLLGLTLAQLRREGTPCILSAMDPAALDMRNMISPYAYAERGVIRSVTQSYGLPTFALSSATDSKLADTQAAAEAALCLMADVQMGGNLIHDLGYLEAGLTFSFEQLVLCDQMVDWVKGFYRPVDTSPESLALDVVRQVEAASGGGDGQAPAQSGYLKTKHTRKYYKEHWTPGLFDRSVFGEWQAKGGMSLSEVIRQRVDALLFKHTVEALDDGVSGKLKEIREKYI